MRQGKYTLQDIAAMKAEKRMEAAQQRDIVAGLAQGAIAPLKPAARKVGVINRVFDNGMMIFDGVLIGFRVLRKVRRLLR